MQTWLFIVRVQDKPGVLTRMASVFSNRGVSLDSITGHGALGNILGTLIITLRATEKKKNELERTLRRVNDITSVMVYDYNHAHLRKSSLVCLKAGFEEMKKKWIDWQEETGLELVKSGEGDSVYLITGKPITVDALVEKLIKEELLLDIVSSTIAV